MTVNEKGLEAAREAMLEEHASGELVTTDNYVERSAAVCRAAIEAYLRAASKDAEPVAYVTPEAMRQMKAATGGWASHMTTPNSGETDKDGNAVVPLYAAIEPVAASPGVGEPKLTAYETQVLIGTSISGCNMSPDRVFDLKAAWARLYDLGLIDRTDGLAIVTPTGEARIKALLAAAPTSPAPSPAGRDVRDAAFEEEWEQAEGACGRIEMVANHMRNGDAARGVLLEAVQTIRALSSKQRSGE